MNKWSIIKIGLIVVLCLSSIFRTPVMVGENPPLFIYPIVMFGTFVFGLLFFKGASIQKKLTVGSLSAPIKSIVHDPLPLYHFIAIAIFFSGMFDLIRSLFGGLVMDPITLFGIAFAIGAYSSVKIANKYFIKEHKKLKKV